MRWGLAGIAVLFCFSLLYVFPHVYNQGVQKMNASLGFGLPTFPEKSFNLGLDLQGGAHLVYEANVDSIPAADRASAVEGVRDVIERRVNGLGVSEPTVQTTNVGARYNIIVELPGVKNVNRAIALIGETPILEFREPNEAAARTLTAEEQKQMDAFNVNAKADAVKILKEIQTKKNLPAAIAQYSEDATSKNNNGYFGYVNPKTIDPAVYAWAASAKQGALVSAPIDASSSYYIVERGQVRDGEVEVHAKHILICFLGADNCVNPIYTKTEAEQKAKELFTQANASNFESLAKQFSSDPGSKDNGGDLGIVRKGETVESFDTALFAAKAGEILGPVESSFGYHIIYKVSADPIKEYELTGLTIAKKTVTDILPPQEDFKATGLSGKQLQHTEVVTDQQTGAVQVSIQFNDEGKELFRKITEKNIGKPIAIYLDGNVISAPTVQQIIPDGRAVISGRFSLLEARTLSQRLNAGALPVPVELVSQQTVGATLGIEALDRSIQAGILGFILVVIFMIAYYRLPGLLAAIALTVYVALNLAIFKLIGVTLTLSGIAGMVMSIGIAVDANVLIFERLKEELRLGKSLRAALEEGFLRAWPSIRDSNISSLFTALLLMWFGTSFVKGFAVTLILGILVHMFTAITVTRVLLRYVVPWFGEFGNRLFLGARGTTRDNQV